jgi:type II secretory pathway pseudopilin PulG
MMPDFTLLQRVLVVVAAILAVAAIVLLSGSTWGTRWRRRCRSAADFRCRSAVLNRYERQKGKPVGNLYKCDDEKPGISSKHL